MPTFDIGITENYISFNDRFDGPAFLLIKASPVRDQYRLTRRVRMPESPSVRFKRYARQRKIIVLIFGCERLNIYRSGESFGRCFIGFRKDRLFNFGLFTFNCVLRRCGGGLLTAAAPNCKKAAPKSDPATTILIISPYLSLTRM